MRKLEGTDQVSKFPELFNELVEEVEGLRQNTYGIKWATWITAGSTVVLATVALITMLFV